MHSNTGTRHIYIDYDSTLNNLLPIWLGWINEKYNTLFTPKDITSYSAIVNLPGIGNKAMEILGENKKRYTEEVSLLEGAYSFVEELVEKYGYENITILTSTLNEMTTYKLGNLSKNFGSLFDKLDIQLIPHVCKSRYVNPGDIIIDDHFKHVYNSINKGAYGVLFYTPETQYYTDILYSNPRYLKACSYNEVLDFIGKIK